MQESVGWKVSIPDDEAIDEPFMGTVISIDTKHCNVKVLFEGDDIAEASDIPYTSTTLEWVSPPKTLNPVEVYHYL